MSFASLLGNENNKSILRRALQSGRLPHALIFAGAEGIGKRQFAITLAKAINCERFIDESCDRCGSCHRIELGASRDVKIIGLEKDRANVRIDQIREMAAEAYARPMEGRKRVFIVDPADKMMEPAMNSMLKTLEEPADTSVIILITSRPDSLLTTIRSRCQILRFAPLSIEEVEQYLTTNYKRPAAETRLLAKITAGRLGAALATDLSVYRERREEILDLLDLLTGPVNYAKLARKAELIAKRERDEFEASLDILCQFLRDIVGLLAGSDGELTHEDVKPRLERIASELNISRISDWFSWLEELRRNLKVNISRQLAMEALLIRLTEQPVT